MKKLFLAILVVSGLSGEDLRAVFNTGEQSANLLLKTLGGELKKKLQEGDLKGAIEFCATNGLSITHQLDEKLGENISIKRISMKNRNPENLPNDSEAKILYMLENSPQSILTRVSDGSYKLYKPVRVAKPVCLKCHGKGEDMPEVARKTIHSLYPQDRATGYSMGDLRGAVVVTIRGE
jgi:hypothetical protein